MSVVALLTLLATGAFAIQPPFVATSPRLDGVLDDPCWREAARILDFRPLGRPRESPPLKTLALVVQGDRCLYVAFDCEEPHPERLCAPERGRDGPVWVDDSVEVFLDTDCDGAGYYHFVVNAAGSFLDEYRTDRRWNAKGFRVAVKVWADRWVVEMAIPFESLRVEPLLPEWGFNVNRNIRTFPDRSWLLTWAPVETSFHEPENFGRLVGLRLDLGRFAVRPLLGALSRLSARARSLKIGSRRESARPFLEALSEVAAEIATLRRRLLQGSPSPRLVREASKQVAEIRSRLDELAEKRRGVLAMLSMERRLGRLPLLLVGTTHSLRKVLRDEFFIGDPSGEARISAARGEHESFQILVAAPLRPLVGVKVAVGDLVRVGGPERIGKENISVRLVGFVKIEKPMDASVSRPGQWWPDPLMPLERREEGSTSLFGSFDVPKGRVQPLWVTVYVPRNIAPGNYRGEFRILAEGAGKAIVKLTLHVWDFSLPVRPRLKTSFGLWLGSNVAKFYGGKVTPGLRRKFVETLLKHRVTPRIGFPLKRKEGKGPPFFDYSEFDAELSHWLSKGLTCFPVGPFARKPNVEELRELVAHLRAMGWLNMAYDYIFDEPTEAQYPKVRELARAVREADPGLKILLTEPPHPDLYGYVDIWCPVTSQFDPKAARERQRLGEEVWWYVCCGPSHPYANFFIDYPALDHRILFWQNWRFGVTGFLYWSTTYWRTNPFEDARQYPGANGDGFLLYPGKDGPVESVRLEVIRDGIEDYDYLSILSDLAAELAKCGRLRKDLALLRRARKALDVSDLTPSLTDYVKTPTALFERRDRIARLIECLRQRLEELKGAKGLGL